MQYVSTQKWDTATTLNVRVLVLVCFEGEGGRGSSPAPPSDCVQVLSVGPAQPWGSIHSFQGTEGRKISQPYVTHLHLPFPSPSESVQHSRHPDSHSNRTPRRLLLLVSFWLMWTLVALHYSFSPYRCVSSRTSSLLNLSVTSFSSPHLPFLAISALPPVNPPLYFLASIRHISALFTLQRFNFLTR